MWPFAAGVLKKSFLFLGYFDGASPAPIYITCGRIWFRALYGLQPWASGFDAKEKGPKMGAHALRNKAAIKPKQAGRKINTAMQLLYHRGLKPCKKPLQAGEILKCALCLWSITFIHIFSMKSRNLPHHINRLLLLPIIYVLHKNVTCFTKTCKNNFLRLFGRTETKKWGKGRVLRSKTSYLHRF